MPTLKLARANDLPPDERRTLEELTRCMGTTPDRLADIWRAQFHWPGPVEANFH